MSQLDYLAAQSIAREREHDLQLALRRRQASPEAVRRLPRQEARRHWFQDVLVHLHVPHAIKH